MCKKCEEEHRHFVCECGKEFKNQKAISGHQANCKVHLKLLEEEREKRRLPNGLFKCENPDCSNEHDGSYASGRFCSEECYRHVIGLRSAQSRREHPVKRMKDRSPYGTWKCRVCGKIFETKRELKSHRYEVHHYDKSHAWNWGLTKKTSKSVALGIKTLQEGFASGRIQPAFKGRHHSQQTRQKLS